MIVAVPLYVNPTTGATGADTVSLVLTQGTQSSAPITVDIQDLPSVASYGATPGQISHAALIFEAMVIGQRINDLQAFQALPGNTVDTSAAQSALQTLLTPILKARSDVDSVTSNSSLVISGGVSTASGSPVQFDATALDTMDRVNGVFLSEVLTLPGSNTQLRSKASKARPQESGVSTFIEGMDLVTNLASYEESMLTTLSSGQSFSSYTVSDYATALSKTIGTTLSTSGTLSGNELLGISGAVFSALPTIGTAMGNDAAWVQAWVTGNTSQMNAAQTEMDAGQTEAWKDMTDLTAALVGGPFEKIVQATNAASFVLDMVAESNEAEESGEYAPIDLQSVPISNTTPPSSPSQGIAIAEGTITVPGSTAQSGLDFCCFNDLGITGIVDADGNYESFIPLGAANTDYGDITLDATDPLTGATLATETVDLSGLDTTAPITLPTLTIPPPTGGSLTGVWSGPMTANLGGCIFTGTMTWSMTESGTALSGMYQYSGSLTSGPVDPCGSTDAFNDTFTGSVSRNTISLTGASDEVIAATVNGTVITGTMTVTADDDSWTYTLTEQ
jgi:hypothetical protein